MFSHVVYMDKDRYPKYGNTETLTWIQESKIGRAWSWISQSTSAQLNNFCESRVVIATAAVFSPVKAFLMRDRVPFVSENLSEQIQHHTATKPALVASLSVGGAAAIVLGDDKGKTVSNYAFKFVTRVTQPTMQKVPVIPKLAAYALSVGTAFALPPILGVCSEKIGFGYDRGEKIGNLLFPVITSVGACKFFLSDLLGLLKRATKADQIAEAKKEKEEADKKLSEGTIDQEEYDEIIEKLNEVLANDDEDEEEDEAMLPPQNWIFKIKPEEDEEQLLVVERKEGYAQASCAATVERRIDSVMSRVLWLFLKEREGIEGVPRQGTVIGIQAAVGISALASNIFLPGSFIALLTTNGVRKYLKRMVAKTPLYPRWATEAALLLLTAGVDYFGPKLPIKFLPVTADIIFSLLTIDVKKGTAGKLKASACFSCLETEGKKEKMKKDKEISAETKFLSIAGTLTMAAGANLVLPGSVAAQYGTDLYSGAIKGSMKNGDKKSKKAKVVPLVGLYTLFGGLIAGGYAIEHYTAIPLGTIHTGVAVNNLIADISEWLNAKPKNKKVAIIL